MTPLIRSLKRQVGDLIITLTYEGIYIRKKYQRRPLVFVTFDQLLRAAALRQAGAMDEQEEGEGTCNETT